MSEPSNSFNSLAGTPTHYARPPVAPYGSRGKLHTFHATLGFEDILNACFSELWVKCPLGRAEIITSAGAFVDKPGQHGHGTAFDLDGLFWTDREFVTLKYPDDRRFYLGVEAILKKHFGTVLDYNYNVDHHDHLHMDTGSVVGFGSGKQTTALFVGAALNHVFGRKVPEGPVLTNAMRAALADVLTENGIPTDLSQKEAYFQWLDLVASTAWANVSSVGATNLASSPPPVDLPAMVRSVVELVNTRLADHPARKDIESAVTFLGNAISRSHSPAAATPFSTPKASSKTANGKGASTTTGLSGTKIDTSPGNFVVEATETVTAKRDGTSLGSKSLAHRRVCVGGTTVVEQANYCWKDRWLPNATLVERHGGFGSGNEVFSGKATYFGKFDNMDEGTGSPLWSLVQTNSSVFGASIKRQHLLNEGLAENGPGNVLRLTEKGRTAMLEVYYKPTDRMIRVPLVDVGPGPSIKAVVDLTVAATAFLQNLQEGDPLNNIAVTCRIVS